MMRTQAIVALFVCTAGCSQPQEPTKDMGGSDVPLDFSDAAADGGADIGTDLGGPDCVPTAWRRGETPPATLSEWCLDGRALPFEPAAVLFADDSLKERSIVMPEGGRIVFDEDERWTFPDDTILVKTFYYLEDERDPSRGRRLLETRLMVKSEGIWEPIIYVWNDEQTEAEFHRLGQWIDVERIDADGETVQTRYRVPNKNQCGSCHDQNDVLTPLGPRTFQLNHTYDYGGEVGTANQLEHWESLGWFDRGVGETDALFSLVDFTDDSQDLDARARSYLEVNCAHCHNSNGAADPSGLKLSVTVTEPAEFGVCRRPVAAGGGSGGLLYDISPGDPDNSILVFRMSSTDPEIKMPELPTQTADDTGVLLMREWIEQMTYPPCE